MLAESGKTHCARLNSVRLRRIHVKKTTKEMKILIKHTVPKMWGRRRGVPFLFFKDPIWTSISFLLVCEPNVIVSGKRTNGQAHLEFHSEFGNLLGN